MTTNLSKPCESKNNEISENTSDNIEVEPKPKNIKTRISLSAVHVAKTSRATAEQEHIIKSSLTPDKYKTLSFYYFGTFIPPSRLTRDEASLFISQHIQLPEHTDVIKRKEIVTMYVEPKFKNIETKITDLTTNCSNSTELSMGGCVKTKPTHPRKKSNLKIPLSMEGVMEDVDIRPHKNKCSSSEGDYKSIWDTPPSTCESPKISFIPSDDIANFIPSDDIANVPLKPPTQQLNSSKITGTKKFQRRMSTLFCDEIEQSSDEMVKEKDEEENA